MSEDYRIVSEAHGEPLPAGSVGVRIRVQLSGCPDSAWSRDLSACLARELVGHGAIGHLRLNVNEIVQGDEIVLEGVEGSEAAALGRALRKAVAAANRARTAPPKPAANAPQQVADAIADEIGVQSPP